jgi:hypothetical protein
MCGFMSLCALDSMPLEQCSGIRVRPLKLCTPSRLPIGQAAEPLIQAAAIHALSVKRHSLSCEAAASYARRSRLQSAPPRERAAVQRGRARGGITYAGARTASHQSV